MPSCDVLCSLNDKSHVFDCAPTPQCDVYAHDLNVDFSNLGCTSSSLVEPQPSTPFESLIATFESQIRCIELDNELGPSKEMILNSMRGQLEIMKKNEERLEEGRRRKEELESQLSPLMLVCEKSQFNVCVEDDDDDFEQPRECEDPIGEHMSDGEGVENEESVDFENPNPFSHLDESQVHDCDPFIHEYLDSFEVMSNVFIECQMKTHSLLSEFIKNASWERDDFEMNLHPFMHGFEILGFKEVEGVVVHDCSKGDYVVPLGSWMFEGDHDHECSSFEDSMIDFHAQIGDLRNGGEEETICKTIAPIPFSHVPFSRNFNHIPYTPISLPSFVNEPIGDPLAYEDFYVPHSSSIEEKGDFATQKDFCEESFPFYSSSYFLEFSFDSSSSWKLPLHLLLRALILVHALLISFAYLLSYEMCSSAFDKLLRSLQYYLLERSSLDLKQAFLGK